MASNSGASGSHGQSKSSRFSTMKLFKLNGKEKPPPPPPKDPYYLPNKSMTSLSPDSVSLPPQSPLSPHYLTQYPHGPAPSQSTMSLVSSAASQLSVPRIEQDTPKRKKSINFLKFGKRSKSRELDVPPPPGEDENISWPSNFQHNIHVDDGLLGLPPSWSKSLADMGYSEEEIANLNVKRAVNSRAVQQLYNTIRPESPASAHHPNTTHSQSSHNDRSASPSSTHQSTASPILTHPLPRSTSLVRKYSNASVHGRAPLPPLTSVPVPPLTTSPSSASLRSIQTTNTSNHSGPPRSNTAPSSHNASPSIGTTSSDANLSYQTIGPDFSVGGSYFHGTGPVTPTKRMHLTNPNTPPPAYSVPKIPSNPTVHKETKLGPPLGPSKGAVSGPIMAPPIAPTVSLPIPPPVHVPQLSTGPTTWSQTTKSTGSSETRPIPQRQQSDTLSRPPRLSLHASNESDDWSKLVLSASLLDAVGQNGGDEQHSTSQRARAKAPLPPSRPIPSIKIPDVEGEESSNSARALPTGWAEPATTARYPPPSAASAAPSSSSPSLQEFKRELEDYVEKDDFKEPPYSAAYTESFSPIIPDSISRSRQRDTLRATPNGALLAPPQERYTQQGESHLDEDDDLLSVRRSNRDSSRSSSSTLSTSTVTGYTYSTPPIIRNASIIRRTGAYVTKVPISPGAQLKESLPPSPLQRSQFQTQMQALSEAPAETPPLSPRGADFRNDASGSTPSRRSVPPPSPMNSQFGSDESTRSTSTTSSSSQSQDHPTPITEPGSGSGLACYVSTPSPSNATFPASVHNRGDVPSPRDTFGNIPNIPKVGKVISEKGGVSGDESFVDLGKDDDEYDDVQLREGEDEDEGEEGTWETLRGNTAIAMAINPDSAHDFARPAIIVSGDTTLPAAILPTKFTLSSSLPATPLTPAQRYPGWLSGVVKPLSPFIDEAIEPREHYIDLQEIAEGESGSIYAAHLKPDGAKKLRLPAEVRARDTGEIKKGEPVLVAIKIIAIAPPSSGRTKTPEAQKLVDLERELTLMKGLWHENILGLDALYVDLTEDTLWVRMELMERSLADIVGLVVDGLMLQDRMIARFARDILQALEFLQRHRIAHRDVRSDNLLLNSHGVLKLTDFSNAVVLPKESSLRSDPAGVIFWQAPEMRYPNYDALKVDVWSLGATMWEMAETEPPFSDTKQVQSRWPTLTRPEMWSPAFHSFLRACSDSATVRKNPTELIKDPFVSNACGRGVIVQLLSQCMNIERVIQGSSDP